MTIKSFNKDYLEYLVPQRTRLLTEYAIKDESSSEDICGSLTKMMNRDYEMILPFLPVRANNILDIGCGIGLIDAALFNHYDNNVSLHLLDKTNSIEKGTNVGGFKNEYVFYNSLDATRDVLESNGVNGDRIFTYEVSEEALQSLSNVQYDIIISLLSCGWHYPIKTYVDLIKKTLKPNGVLILDIRHNTGQLEYIQTEFNLIQSVENTAESKHTGGTIGDRHIFETKK